jgi:hypothetical protein
MKRVQGMPVKFREQEQEQDKEVRLGRFPNSERCEKQRCAIPHLPRVRVASIGEA